MAVYVNKRWCNPGHITVKEQRCTKNIELLTISTRPYHLVQEFLQMIALTVCVPPSADATAACEDIHSTVFQLQTAHPQFLTTLPNFTHYVVCHTRDNKTLDAVC